MAQSKTSLLTPIYIKPRPDTAWPDDPVFYLLTGKGLFLCRNHEFFQSSVPAPRPPAELAAQETFLAVRYPKVPRRLMEQVVGYFDRVAELHGSEAAALLAWDRQARRMEVIVPDQTATVSRGGWGSVYAIGVEYRIPDALPPGLVVIGDVHSHVESAAYASYVDKHDETHRAGLHVVVGRIHREPPELHVEAVIDGARFTVDQDLVIDDYRGRRFDFPDEWLDRIKVETYGRKHYDDEYGSRGTSGAAKTTYSYGSGNNGAQKVNPYGSYHVEPADPYGDFRTAPAGADAPCRDAGKKGAQPAAAEETRDKELLDEMALDQLDRQTAGPRDHGGDGREGPSGPWKLKPETTLKLGYEPLTDA